VWVEPQVSSDQWISIGPCTGKGAVVDSGFEEESASKEFVDAGSAAVPDILKCTPVQVLITEKRAKVCMRG
jgi:hypothetical protein